MSQAVTKLKALYADFLTVDVKSVADLYAESVVFRDPVHEVKGLQAMQAYFAGVCQNLSECRFEFDRVVGAGVWHSLWWVMHYRHPKLQGGKQLHLRGASLIQIDARDTQVVFHEDVYDLGAMVYEQVPLLGTVIRHVKGRLGDSGGENG
ncbi:nuclear transport factor 2 family protein [Microbulbifer elongatus]|uniref:Nuclear transport factor 2 family protein n=1 Tax=Microbulbifer elongatus TaxID=86173 RepID=A0ABT1P0R2_9GAMM|nr:nuclear transport factor 2 family protein [Microbulbifer elongatus]MCQ3829708.1 nuclear transport factor 2 family protein [Microbulbifer elongatus]